MSDDRGSKFLIGAFAASIANKRAKEQREATERMAEAQEEANRIASSQQEKPKKQARYEARGVHARKRDPREHWDGYHSYTYSNGDRVEGEYKDGKIHGQCRITIAPKKLLTFNGEIKFGKAYGQCTYIFRNGNKYVGEAKGHPTSGISSFKPEQHKINCHGQGTFTWANGDQYIGDWKDGKKHGKGAATYTESGITVAHEKGIWMNDIFIGKASVIAWDLLKLYPAVSVKKNKESLTIEDELVKIKELYEKGLITEDLYEQQISIINATGYTSYDNGDKYIGDWKHGKKHGKGAFTWANGDKYVGEWKDNKKHGKGTKTYNHKMYETPAHKWIRKVEKGIWMNDLFIGKPSVIAWDLIKFITKISVKKNKESLTIEDELLKIKELYEKDLITEEVFKARQISIMESYKH